MTLTAYVMPDSSGSSLPTLDIRPEWYRETVRGGCSAAEFSVEGERNQLWLCADLIGREIRVYDERNQVAWWGMVYEVRLNIDGTVFGFSLDGVANRIAVAYTTDMADGSTDRKTTSWAVNQDSINRFGQKELLQSIGDASDELATAAQAKLLADMAWPRGVVSFDGRDGQNATLICVGWYSTLAWRNFTRLEGRIEFEGGVNTPGITQVIGWQLAGNTGISFSGNTIACTTANVFADLVAGAQIIVAGSASNNGTFTLERDAYNNGQSIDVTATLTTESAGASVTISAIGADRIAQKYVQAHAFDLWRVGLKIAKVGSPSGSLQVELRTDSAGSPSATIIATCSLAASSIGTSPTWYWLTAASNPTLSASSTYWLLIKRSTAASATDYFTVSMDETVYETCKAWNGSAWVTHPNNQYVPFRVWGWEDTLNQVKRILSDCGALLTGGQDISITSGVKSNQWRDGDLSALDEIQKLLDMGNSVAQRFTVSVTPDRTVRIVTEATPTETGDILGDGNQIRLVSGGLRTRGDLPVGEWLTIDKAPLHLNALYAISPQFIDEAEYSVGRDVMRLTPKRAG